MAASSGDRVNAARVEKRPQETFTVWRGGWTYGYAQRPFATFVASTFLMRVSITFSRDLLSYCVI